MSGCDLDNVELGWGLPLGIVGRHDCCKSRDGACTAARYAVRGFSAPDANTLLIPVGGRFQRQGLLCEALVRGILVVQTLFSLKSEAWRLLGPRHLWVHKDPLPHPYPLLCPDKIAIVLQMVINQQDINAG